MVTLDAAIATGSGCRRTGNTVDGVEAVSVSSFHNPSAACMSFMNQVVHRASQSIDRTVHCPWQRTLPLSCR